MTCRLRCQAIVEVKWWFANKGTTERYMLGIRAKFCTLNIVYVASRPFRSREERVNTLRPIQNGRHFPDDIFKCIFLNGNVWISLIISLNFVPKVRINNIPALVQIMAWRRSGDKPLSKQAMVYLLTHICVTRPQWVIKQTRLLM